MGIARYFVWAFCFLGLSINLIGQETTFLFHHLTNEHLTSQQYNYFIFQDSQGFIWISSTIGLNRFDGDKVRKFEKRDFPNGQINIQSNFFEDTDGNLWFKAGETLHCYDRKMDRIVDVGIKGKPLYLEQEKNEIWLLENSNKDAQLVAYPLNGLTAKLSNHQIGKTYGHNIEMIKKENGLGYLLFVPLRDGFNVFNILPNNINEILYTKRQNGFAAYDFHLENDSICWVAADTGLLLLNLGTGSIEGIFHDFQNEKLKSIKGIVSIGGRQFLVATHKQGVYFFDKKKPLGFTKRLNYYFQSTVVPFDEHIDEIYLDGDDNLWVSTENNGIFHTNLQKRKFRSFLQRSPTLPQGVNHIEGMSVDKEGRIWCLTKNGVAVVDLEGNLVSGHEKYLGSGALFGTQEPNHILCDAEGGIWVSMQKGLYYTPGFGVSFRLVPESRGTLFLCDLGNGRILTSTFGSVMEAHIEEGWPNCKTLPELTSYQGAIIMIYKEEDLVYFSEYEDSIHVFDLLNENLVFKESFRAYGAINGFAHDSLLDRTWVATAKGLYFFEMRNGSLQFFPDDYLTDLACQSILIGNEGEIWLGTVNQGLVRYSPFSTDPEKRIQKYSVADGIQSKEFNFWSASKAGKNLLFGGVNGVNFFNPTEITPFPVQARPTITSMTVNGGVPLPESSFLSGIRNISMIDQIVLDYEYNEIELNVAGLEYSDPQSIKYEYKMSKEEDSWRPLESNILSLSELREGDYRFLLKASNSDGEWPTDKVAKLNITVLPPWYRTEWFYSLLAILALLAGYIFYKYRISQIRKAEAIKREIAEAKQQVAETETAILRLQMNPHFIFNSMNSINSYILKKDVETASGYLNRFSKLMRMILDLAANPYVAVYEEAEFLELYMDTEAMRFEEKFTYEIIMDEQVDPDDTILPTMILQPFVENAIWHGLTEKGSQGHVKVQFQKQNGSLVCSVEDNGQGRQAANAASIGKKEHVSKALTITNERLERLKKETGKPAHFNIIDLKGTDGEAIGTKVVLTLPLL